jgi:hypothetical protein
MWSSELLLLLMACPPVPQDSDAPPLELEEVDCELGQLQDEAFVPLQDGDEAELWLGFQGFLFLLVRARSEEAPVHPTALFSLTLDGEESSSGSQPDLDFEGTLSDEILVFLPSANVSAYEGRAASLAVRLQGPERTCLDTVEVQLVDLDPCIHTDAEPICPEDSGR